MADLLLARALDWAAGASSAEPLHADPGETLAQAVSRALRRTTPAHC